MNGSDLKAWVKKGGHWRNFDTARFQISVGQDYHEGEELRAALAWASERFGRVIICVNDALQRHNLELDGHTPEAARAFAEAAGREWIERNSAILRTVPNCEVIRWGRWLTDPAYPAELRRMQTLYETNPVFRAEVEKEVRAFWTRQVRRNPALAGRFEEFREHSTAYLLEECAAFQLMFRRDDAIDVYPGSSLLPCKVQVGARPPRGFCRLDFTPALPAMAG